jgi:hypothetical protein
MVLLAIYRSPGIRVRDIALAIGLTERRVQQVIRDLLDADLLHQVRPGRRGRYEIRLDATISDPPLLRGVNLGEWLAAQPVPAEELLLSRAS